MKGRAEKKIKERKKKIETALKVQASIIHNFTENLGIKPGDTF